MAASIHGGTPKWLVYKGKSQWMMNKLWLNMTRRDLAKQCGMRSPTETGIKPRKLGACVQNTDMVI